MEILLTEQFESAYEKLSATDKRSVRNAVTLLSDNTRYPGLRVKKMEGRKNIWEARPSDRLQMTFEMTEGVILLRNVWEHDNVLKRP